MIKSIIDIFLFEGRGVKLMTDPENTNLKSSGMDANVAEQLKRAQQQIIQKDNLIRLLNAKIKKQKETPDDGSGSEQSAILANLENEMRKLNEELKEKEASLEALKQENSQLSGSKDELQNEFNALKKQYEILSESKSSAGAEDNGENALLKQQIEDLKDRVASLNDEVGTKNKEIQSLKFQAEKEAAEAVKATSALKEREIEIKKLQSGVSASEHLSGGAAAAMIEKHIKGGKFLPEESSKMLEILTGIRSEMAKVIEDKAKENEKLIEKLKKTEDAEAQNKLLAERSLQLEEKVKYLKTVSESQVNDNYSDFKILVSHIILALDEFYEAYVYLDSNDIQNFKIKVSSVFEMIKGALKTVKVHPIATIGEKYNPQLHEVVEFVRSKEHDDDTIVDEVLKGYTLNDEILRQSKIKVIKNRFKCSACGNISRVGSQFCDSCGNKLETLTVPYKDIKNTGSLYFQTGKIFEEKNMYDKSREYYQQAVALEPLNITYIYNLARILEYIGEYENAMTTFKRIPETDQRFEDAAHHIKNIEIKMTIIEGIKNINTYK